MKRKPSFNLNEEHLQHIANENNQSLTEAIKASLYNTNELTEQVKKEYDLFIEELYEQGYYPFIYSTEYKNEDYSYINNILESKDGSDGYILSLLVLEKEIEFIKICTTDEYTLEVQEKIKYFKELL